MSRPLRDFEIIDGKYYVSTLVAAVICGVTQQSFNNWRRDQKPPPWEKSTGLVPLDDLGEWIRSEQVLKRGRGGAGFPYLPNIDKIYNNNGLRGGPVENESPESRLKRLQGDKAQIELDEKAGLLIPVEDVSTAWTRILSRVRTRLLKLPVTLAPLVTGVSDAYAVQERLTDAVHEALEELASDHDDEDDNG